MSVVIKQITEHDIGYMEDLMTVFGDAFNEKETYTGNRPGARYLRKLLSSSYFIALAGIHDGQVVGGLTAYELTKFEQQRSEIFIYDLAVAEAHRRQGVATALIEKLKLIAAKRGAYLIVVEADTGIEDKPAIALYSKLGNREEVLHFDIAVSHDNGTE